MFTRFAKFRPFEPQRVAARWGKVMLSNDNLPGRRRAARGLRSPPPTLVCHWFLKDSEGRLECSWETADLEEGSVGRPGCHLTVTQKLEAMSLVAHRSLAVGA